MCDNLFQTGIEQLESIHYHSVNTFGTQIYVHYIEVFILVFTKRFHCIAIHSETGVIYIINKQGNAEFVLQKIGLRPTFKVRNLSCHRIISPGELIINGILVIQWTNFIIEYVKVLIVSV